MSIMKIRYKDGNFVDIKAIKGSDGKSAYEQAKEGGYTGTEEEFIQILGSLSSVNAMMLADDDNSCEEHIANQNNPHNVTAEQTGAMPEVYYASDDLNTEMQSGGNKMVVCNYHSGTLNTPYKEGLTVFAHGMVITNAHSNQYGTQLCMPSGEEAIYVRRLNGQGLSKWVKMADCERLNALINELSSVSAYINNSVVPRLAEVESTITNNGTGSYTGTGTTSNQEITVGGSGSILMITSSNNDIAFVHAYGAHSYPNNGSDFSVKQSNAKFDNGVLTLINNTYAGLNASGITYYYKVL